MHTKATRAGTDEKDVYMYEKAEEPRRYQKEDLMTKGFDSLGEYKEQHRSTAVRSG